MSETFARRLRNTCLCCCACACAFSAQAAGSLGGSISVASDYVYRGVSQTHGEPALQGDLHYQTSNGWAFGAWGSAADVDKQQSAALEVDLYLSRNWTLDRNW